MPEEIDDIPTLEPFEIINRAEETNGAFVRVEVTLHPFGDKTQHDTDLTHRRWIVDGIGEHFHPKQDEYFSVRAGDLRVVLPETNYTLTAGDEIVIPAGTVHRHWNPAEQPARVLVEHRPAGQSDVLLETLYTLAQAGKTDESGVPNTLQSMVLQHAYADHAYATSQPVSVQKGFAALLAPIGRLAGYQTAYSMDDFEELG